jgi:aldose 1-epimerase
MDWTVNNEDDSKRLPLVLAIHPFFPIIGTREQVRIQVPSKKWMEAVELIPTGRRLDLADGPADLNAPTPLSELNLDDVFWGLEKAKPQVIYYDAIGKKLVLTADDYYSFSVVFTPTQAPFFCCENQSCSTNAHNLYNQGLADIAQLSILEPGQSLKSTIKFNVADLLASAVPQRTTARPAGSPAGLVFCLNAPASRLADIASSSMVSSGESSFSSGRSTRPRRRDDS